MASFKSSPRAVTPSTRPPDVSSPPAPSRVPAWKTVAPVASAASIPLMGLPVSKAPGYPPEASTTQTLGSRVHSIRAPASLPSAAASSSGTKSDCHAVHQRLRLGVAQADVELEDLGAVGGHHQAGIEEAGEAGGVHGGIDDRAQNLLRLGVGQDAGIAICAHAAGVGSGVAIEDGFVILRGRERDHVAAVAQRDEADFFAAQKLFDHQAALQLAERGFGLGAVLRDDDAFSGREAVGFEDHGKAEAVERARASAGVVGGGEAGGWDSALRKKALCENLTAFQLSGGAAGSDDESARARGTRRRRRRPAEPPVRRRSDPRRSARRLRGTRLALGRQVADLRHARISGRREDFHPRRLRQFPTQRMLAPAASEDQNLHFATIITMQEKYDVVVIGAGHAGCEAARACARMGLKTAMVTMNLDLIAQMSCNPAIGGIAKGHLVREIDALGGVMGEVADAVGIQFRLLNTSRGPAVWSPRAQMDKRMYRVRMREVLEQEPNLRIKQAEVASLV